MGTQVRFREGDVAWIVREHYGLTGHVEPLVGYVDQNFRLDAQGEERFVLKLSSVRASEGATVALQHAVLGRLADEVGLPAVPRVVRSSTGRDVIDVKGPSGDAYHARLLRWVEGVAWSTWARSRDVRLDMLASVGTLTAVLGRALAGFEHPDMERHDPWDPRQFLAMRRHVDEVEGGSHQAIVERVMRRFETQVGPLFGRLPHSVVHGDVNNDNVLLDPNGLVVGLIDFGDAIRTATICELAIAVAYAMLDHPRPMEAVRAVVAGYLVRAELRPEEKRVLPTLVAARLVTSVVFAAYHRRRTPENVYIGSNEASAWSVLEEIDRGWSRGEVWDLGD